MQGCCRESRLAILTDLTGRGLIPEVVQETFPTLGGALRWSAAFSWENGSLLKGSIRLSSGEAIDR